jgi:hypothetical protein
VYSAINENVLHVSWEEPYAPDEYPIISYYTRVVDTYDNSRVVLTHREMSADTFSFDIAQTDAASCTNLTMEVWAANSINNGTAGVAYGAFPASELWWLLTVRYMLAVIEILVMR